MKTVLSFLASICFSVLFASLSLASDDMVKLVRAENFCVTGYNNGSYLERKVLIQVKNVAYSKQVYVHQSKIDGTWVDIPAHYVRQGNSIYELWEADRHDFGDISSLGNNYAIKYIVNGQTYWDNNDGANYTFSYDDCYLSPGPRLGNDINVLLYNASVSGGMFSGYVDVRNIAYSKKVTIVYTTNNWATYAIVDGSFIGQQQTGYSSFINFPNVYNIERWRFAVPVTAAQIQFAISYTVNGVTYWDNNYGVNYTAM